MHLPWEMLIFNIFKIVLILFAVSFKKSLVEATKMFEIMFASSPSVK